MLFYRLLYGRYSTECCSACHYAGCHHAEYLLHVGMLDVPFLSAVMLDVPFLSAVMLNVVAPLGGLSGFNPSDQLCRENGQKHFLRSY
jgi:hypothetical protein